MPLSPLALVLLAAVADRSHALCDRLGEPAYRDRAAAARQLTALGEVAVPALHRAAASPNPEVARRAAELAAGITASAALARRTAATPIVLDFPSATVADVFASIEAQAGCRFAVASEASAWKDRAVTVRTGGPVPFWAAVEQAAEAAGWQVADGQQTARPSSNYSPPPYLLPGNVLVTSAPAPDSATGGDPPPVLLAQRGGRAGALAVGTAVRVRAADLPADARPAFPADVMTVSLQFLAEPRLTWLSTTGVRVTRATAADGRPLAADLTAPVTDPLGRGEQLVLHPAGKLVQVQRNGEPVKIWVPTDPSAAVVRVKADRPTDKLAELRGVVSGVARLPPEVVAAVVLAGAKPVAADGPDGITLKAVAGDPGTLEVAIGYPAFRVLPAGGSWRDMRMAEFAARRGIPMRPRESRYWTPDDGDEIEGVSVVDAAGRRFDLSAKSLTTAVELRNGDPIMHRTLKLTAAGTKHTTGGPVGVRFRAAVERTVSVGFTLADVPVTAGTAKP